MDLETADEIRRHFSVVAEGLRSEIRVVAEGVSATPDRLDRFEDRLDRFETRMVEELGEIKAMLRISFGQLDRRLTSLEADISGLRARLEKLEARFGN